MGDKPMFLDFPPHTEQAIIATAQAQGQSVEQFILSFIAKTPNAETLEAIAELENGKGVNFDSVEALMNDLNDKGRKE